MLTLSTVACVPVQSALHTPTADDVFRQIKSACVNLRDDIQSDFSRDPEGGNKRVTVWNPTTGKKLSGNAGVFKKNLSRYLETHPDWSVWKSKEGIANKAHPKRKRTDALDQPRKRVAEPTTFENDLQSSLWSVLLAVCSEEAIIAHEDMMLNDTKDLRNCPMPPSMAVFSPGRLITNCVG